MIETANAISFATLAAGTHRLNELRTEQRELQNQLGDKSKKERMIDRYGTRSYNAWRSNKVRELDKVSAELSSVKAWCQRKRRAENINSARITGITIDPSDSVQIISALQGVVRTMAREYGVSLGDAPDDVRAIMQLADDFRAMPDHRYIGWDEHIAALIESGKQRKDAIAQAKEMESERVKQIYDRIEQEREEWRIVIEQYKNPARMRVTIKEPPDYASLKDQIRDLQRRDAQLRGALQAVYDAEQLVTEKHLQAVGILHKILVTPELQDMISDLL